MINTISPSANNDNEQLRLFLAGTIDNGNSENWQSTFIDRYNILAKAKKVSSNVVIYNPRQDVPPTDLENQINWELTHLEMSDLIVMNILPNSKSPISLLELGLFARSGKLIVICPPEFYRYTNVKVTCDAYNIPLYTSFENFFDNWTIIGNL